MKKSKFIPLFALIGSFCLLPIGKGDWSTLNKIGSVNKSSITAVCYIGSKKFFTLDDALYYAESNDAADAIYVIPGLFDLANATDEKQTLSSLKIRYDHTIKEGDSLILPYDAPSEDNDFISSDKGADAVKSFADSNWQSNRKTLVSLEDGVSLTVEGTFSIGAITGTTSTGIGVPTGAASSSYCELLMGSGSTLTVNGTLSCYGFIKDSGSNDSEIIINGLVDGEKSGTLTTPIAFYDFEGGTKLTLIQANGVFPLSRFDIAQIQPKMTFNYGSSLVGQMRLYSSQLKTYITASANLLGMTNSFINMGAGSSIEWQYEDSSSYTTNNDFGAHSTSIKAKGGSIEFGSLSVSGVDSSDYYLPIPCGYSIDVASGATCTLPDTVKGIKFMPGSSLTCESGATIDFNANVLFYQGTSGYKADGSAGGSFSYPSSEAATFINDGTVNINEGFEGKIETSATSTATTVFGASYAAIASDKSSGSKEGTDSSTYYCYGGAFGKIGESSDGTTKFLKSNTYDSKSGEDYWNGETEEEEKEKKDIDGIKVNVYKEGIFVDGKDDNEKNVFTSNTYSYSPTNETNAASTPCTTDQNTDKEKDYTWTIEVKPTPDNYSVYDGTKVEYVWYIQTNIYTNKGGNYYPEGEINIDGEPKVGKEVTSESSLRNPYSTLSNVITVTSYGTTTTKSLYSSGYTVDFQIYLKIKYYKWDGDGTAQTTMPSNNKSNYYCARLRFKHPT